MWKMVCDKDGMWKMYVVDGVWQSCVCDKVVCDKEVRTGEAEDGGGKDLKTRTSHNVVGNNDYKNV